eukprot:5596851-Pyramimonas_sp.AAC.1
MHSDEGVHEHAVGMRARDRGHTMRELALWVCATGQAVRICRGERCTGYPWDRRIMGALCLGRSWSCQAYMVLWSTAGVTRMRARGCGLTGVKCERNCGCTSMGLNVQAYKAGDVLAWRRWCGGVELRACRPAPKVCSHSIQHQV